MQRIYYAVINTDLVPAHTACSLAAETGVSQRIIQMHSSGVYFYLLSVMRATKEKLRECNKDTLASTGGLEKD